MNLHEVLMKVHELGGHIFAKYRYVRIIILKLLTEPSALKVSIIQIYTSVIVEWDEVDDSLPTNYTVTWASERDLVAQDPITLIEKSSFTVNGLTFDTVYTITITAANRCGTGTEFTSTVTLSAHHSIWIFPNPDATSTATNYIAMSTANPTTTASFGVATTTAVAISNTVTTDSTTTSTTCLDATIITSGVVINSIATTTTDIVMSPTSTMKSADTTTAGKF